VAQWVAALLTNIVTLEINDSTQINVLLKVLSVIGDDKEILS
jgi:hypothetical protein